MVGEVKLLTTGRLSATTFILQFPCQQSDMDFAGLISRQNVLILGIPDGQGGDLLPIHTKCYQNSVL